MSTPTENPWDLPAVDLRTLLSEMAALKSEVRAETVASRELREELSTTLTQLQPKQTKPKAQLEAAEAIFDIMARLEPALRSAEQLAQPRQRWFRRTVDPVASSLHEGLQLSLRRLRQQLSRWQIEPIEALHQPFDPLCMEALDTTHSTELPDGHVAEEITRGYRGPEGILRFAQVIVNKQPSGQPSTLPTSGAKS